MKSPDKKEECCEKCKWNYDDLPLCTNTSCPNCHNKVEVSECCGAEERGVSVNLDSSAPHQKYYGRICSKCGKPFVVENKYKEVSEHIEKVGKLVRDKMYAPPQESKEEQEFNEDARMIDKIEGQESKASWSERLQELVHRNWDRGDEIGLFKEVESHIESLLSKAKTEEREKPFKLFPDERMKLIADIYAEAQKELKADLVKKVEGKKIDIVDYSKKLPPIAKSNRRKNVREKVTINKTLDEVIKILTPQE